MDVWELIKGALASKLSAESFQNWFGRTTLTEFQEGILRVSVPNEATRDYISQEYSDLIAAATRELRLPVRHISYEVIAAPANGLASSPLSNGEVDLVFPKGSLQLNPKFTFESFVVGSCNQFAHAVAKAIVRKPARQYNPLFIYGGTGMGKTHLMHAIGHALLEDYPRLRLVYTSSERFMNQMIAGIKLQRMSLFHQHFRSADVLLMDDIQVLGKKEATQEEFFHTFNDLYENERQIVISSDSPPAHIPGLVERLRSRFECGLMADIQPPDLETKMAILDKKAETAGVKLPEDVRLFIVTKTKSSVRELEGALVRLIAVSSMTDSPITLQMCQQALKHLAPNGDRRITIDSINRAVAARFDLQPAQLKQKSNRREIARPRQIAMYLAKELTQASLPEIGRAYGGKHHTTVLHSIKKIDGLRQRDAALNRLIQSIIDSLG
jgi:chromosomal replication initiator protein